MKRLKNWRKLLKNIERNGLKQIRKSGGRPIYNKICMEYAVKNKSFPCSLQTSLNDAIKNHNQGGLENTPNDEVKRLEESAQNYRNKWIDADKKFWG